MITEIIIVRFFVRFPTLCYVVFMSFLKKDDMKKAVVVMLVYRSSVS